MSQIIKLKRSAVAGKAPTVSDLDLGELAVNTYDGKLYTKKNNGSDTVVEVNGITSPVALTDGTTITPDASLSNTFTLTIAGDHTLANPTNMTPGQTLNFIVSQDAIGSHPMTFGTLFKWPNGVTPTLSTAANAKDVITCLFDGTQLLCTINKAFA